MPEPPDGADRAVLLDLDDTLAPFQTLAHWQWAWKPQGPLLPERHAKAAIRKSVRAWDRRRWQGLVGAAPPVGAADLRVHLHDTLLAVAGPSASSRWRASSTGSFVPRRTPRRTTMFLPSVDG